MMKFRRWVILLIFLAGYTDFSNAQYSFTEFGAMRMNYSHKGPFKDVWWPGFSINVAGIQFSRFAGEVPLRDTGSPAPAGWRPHGSYWNVGYVTNYISRSKKEDAPEKRPITNVYYGFLLGGWRTHEGGSFMSLALPLGTTLNVLPGVSLTAGIEAGMNFKNLFGIDYGPLDPVVEGTQSAFPRFYCNPKLGLRFSYDLIRSIGKVETGYVEPGMRTRYYYSNGITYYQNYWEKGGNYTKNIGTSEIVCVAPVIYFPRGYDGVGITKAAGARITLRYGILASDIQYIKGNIGFRIVDGSFAGSKVNQCYWDYEGTSISLGVNVFSYRTPFKQASIIRFIMGKRWGIANIQSHYTGPSTHILPAPYSGKNVSTSHFYMAAELGRIGVSWDFMKNPERTYEQSGGLIAASYQIPLIRAK